MPKTQTPDGNYAQTQAYKKECRNERLEAKRKKPYNGTARYSPGPIVQFTQPKPQGKPATITGRTLHRLDRKRRLHPNRQEKPGYIKPFVNNKGAPSNA